MMRYSEISRDFSSDSLRYVELDDNYAYRSLQPEESQMNNESGNAKNRRSSIHQQTPQQQQQQHQQQQVQLINENYNMTSPITVNANGKNHNNYLNRCSMNRYSSDSTNSSIYGQSYGYAGGCNGCGSMPIGSSATVSCGRQRKDSTKSTQSCQLDMVEHLTRSANKHKGSTRRKNSIGCLNTMSSSPPGSPGCYYCVSNPPTSSSKSQSLPGHSSMKNFDNVLLSALRVSAEDLANQITLLDFPIFAAIQPDELTSCAWTKKDKYFTTPKIVAFTKRFNHTSFWTVQEILSAEQPKQRAEILTHFIKVAKKLHELNNLHSLFAIISAMQTASIFRLKKTWALLTKKDRQCYERLSEIFSDQNNWENLRSYLESLRLPCIPYLGLFLTDLIYIDLAHPHKGGLEPEQRKNKMNNILRVIASYQQSDYTHLQPKEPIQKYLTSICYIEELQNIFEEDQYKKSLKLEPASPSGPSSSSCSSKESFNIDAVTPALACLNLSPAKTLGSMRIANGNKFIPGHRKCKSLGSKYNSASLPRDCFHYRNYQCKAIYMIAPGIGAISNKSNCHKCRIFGKTSTTHNNDLGYAIVSSNGSYMPTKIYDAVGRNSSYHQQQSRHLLDDSVLENSHTMNTNNGSHITMDAISNASSEGIICNSHGGSCVDLMQPSLSFPSDEHCIQGCVRRKTMQKEGRKPAVASWQRYWLQIWANSLVYFPPKSFKGSERSDFKREPCKVCPLDGWYAQLSDNPKHKNSFQLYHRTLGTIYKFRTDSPQATHMWTHSICKVAAQRNAVKPLPVNLMSFE